MRRTAPCLLSVGFLLIGLQHSAEAQMWKKRPATMKRSTSLKATGKFRSRQLQTALSR